MLVRIIPQWIWALIAFIRGWAIEGKGWRSTLCLSNSPWKPRFVRITFLTSSIHAYVLQKKQLFQDLLRVCALSEQSWLALTFYKSTSRRLAEKPAPLAFSRATAEMCAMSMGRISADFFLFFYFHLQVDNMFNLGRLQGKEALFSLPRSPRSARLLSLDGSAARSCHLCVRLYLCCTVGRNLWKLGKKQQLYCLNSLLFLSVRPASIFCSKQFSIYTQWLPTPMSVQCNCLLSCSFLFFLRNTKIIIASV